MPSRKHVAMAAAFVEPQGNNMVITSFYSVHFFQRFKWAERQRWWPRHIGRVGKGKAGEGTKGRQGKRREGKGRVGRRSIAAVKVDG